MTINIRRATSVNAVGHHVNNNSKPVFCITDGTLCASVTDAAEKVGVTTSVISHAISGRLKTCKGKRYCFISDVMEYLDEISLNIHNRNEKAAAYDAILAEQNAKKEAAEKLAIHQANCEKLRLKLEKEMQMMKEAEILVNGYQTKTSSAHVFQ